MLQNRPFFRFGTEIRFWSGNLGRRCAWFYCALQLCLCRSHCNGCIKVPHCCSCLRNTVVFCSWESWSILERLHQGCDSDLSAEFLNFGADDFPVKMPFKKCFKIVIFFSFGAKAKTQFWSCNFCCYYVQESFSVKKRAVCKSFFCVKTS